MDDFEPLTFEQALAIVKAFPAELHDQLEALIEKVRACPSLPGDCPSAEADTPAD